MSSQCPDESLPAPLRAALEHAKPILLVNGSILWRTEPGRAATCRLRYREPRDASGHRRHRSIPLPPEYVGAVSSLLLSWRKEILDRAQSEADRRHAERMEQEEIKQAERTILAAYGGGRRRRKRLRRQFIDAREIGPVAEMMLQLLAPWNLPNQRRGPKARSGFSIPGAMVSTGSFIKDFMQHQERRRANVGNKRRPGLH